ncbi:dolichyl-phosphate beta-glucosyltransferase [Myiozetetes cayanensis]|uniref:dolichyl-phosphate beta-glucosyltransferase n=1 Tax=Myiozetetes cayanensis TaxID=478635 RepID=UPI00215EFCAE|nr:dolichyl-phosphate beta-glucosyltransferase [Myiozetetes cayanensis]
MTLEASMCFAVKNSNKPMMLTVICAIAHVTVKNMPTLYQHKEEKFFLNDEGRKEPVPSIHDPPIVVVPSYNEEDWLPLMMDEGLDYLEKKKKQDPSFTDEVIVLNDGSKDQTRKVAMEYCKKYGSDKVQLFSMVKSRGRGGAVRMVIDTFISFCV